jgi:hypothetical protein
MLRPHHIILLASLLVDGGTVAPPPAPSGPDAGTVAAPPSSPALDAGTAARKPVIVDGIRWPEDDEVRLLTTLDGRAIVAANAAIQDLMARLAKEDRRYVGSCDASPKAMDVFVFEGEGMYIVSIKRRLDRCGWAHPSFNAAFDPEVYAVSPEGRILARYPYNP